ncbi:hypothetical protein H7K32_12290 [Brevibacillus agri]|nr:hypothetical protein [Brevibacillus agri]MBY0052443.1 hypothetical protein [Brevibacillus agri]
MRKKGQLPMSFTVCAATLDNQAFALFADALAAFWAKTHFDRHTSESG